MQAGKSGHRCFYPERRGLHRSGLRTPAARAPYYIETERFRWSAWQSLLWIFWICPTLSRTCAKRTPNLPNVSPARSVFYWNTTWFRQTWNIPDAFAAPPKRRTTQLLKTAKRNFHLQNRRLSTKLKKFWKKKQILVNFNNISSFFPLE